MSTIKRPDDTARILITGSSGFIGQLLSRRLLCEGNSLVRFDLRDAAGMGGEFVEADISRPGKWADASEGVETVFHLAGKAHALSELRQDEADYFRVNTEGTRYALEAAKAHGVRRFVLFSSIKAMSRDDEAVDVAAPPVRPFGETATVEPDTPYGRSKLAAEELVLEGGYVPEPVVLRLCMVYGDGAKGNMQKMLGAVERRRFPPLPDVPNKRSMVHVEDVLDAALLAANHPGAAGEVFIVSDGKAYSTRGILVAMHAALGRPMPEWSVPVWGLRALGYAGDAIGKVRGRRFVFDSDSIPKLLGSAWFRSEKIQQKLGFRPQWDLERALPSMVAALNVRKARNSCAIV